MNNKAGYLVFWRKLDACAHSIADSPAQVAASNCAAGMESDDPDSNILLYTIHQFTATPHTQTQTPCSSSTCVIL